MTGRVLITGGAGFVGFHLARRLADESLDVTLADDFSRGRLDDELAALAERPNVRLETADLTSPAAWSRLGGGYDEVYHLAAVIGVKHVLERPHEVVRVNALSTIHLLDWFVGGGGRRIVFSSTSEAYAWTQQFQELPIPTPEDVPLSLTALSDPRTSYAASKIFGEVAVQQYCRAHRKSFVVLRYHNVYGPRMGHDHAMPELLERALAGENPLVVYSADHTRAFCYVSDAVEATVAAMRTRAADGETINVGNDREEVAISELATRICARAGADVAIEPRAALNDPIKRRCPDLSRARELLGYEPAITLDEGLDRTIAWYRPLMQSRLAERGALSST